MTTETMIPDLVSAGGVVYKICGDSLQVAVCSRKQPLSHNLPKGTPEVGETLENTACREVEEETGLRVKILDYIGFIEYDSTHGKSSGEELKRVHYFLMRSVGGDFSLHDTEFDVVEWIESSGISSILTYENEVEIVQKGLSMVERRSKGTS